MKPKTLPPRGNPELLHQDLTHVRQLSLTAAGQDDFRTVARLIDETSRLNHLIQEPNNDRLLAGVD